MLIMLAPAALVALVAGLWQGASTTESAIFAIVTALAAFGAWAMGREIAPDDQAAAFVAMAAAVVVMLLLGAGTYGYGLLVLFTTLGLVRQVNRTTGLEARMSDSLVLLALSLWVIYSDVNPLFGLVAAVSFFLDGYLVKPLRRQLVFALFSAGAFVVYLVDHDLERGLYSMPHTLPQWAAALIAVIFALNLLSGKESSSFADVGKKKLDTARIRGGMLVALLAVIQGLPDIRDVGVLTAALAGVCLSSAFRRSFTNPV
jgi:hypothetical protein